MKTLVFETIEQFEKHIGDDVLNDEITAITLTESHLGADLTTNTKSLKIALKRFFKSLDGYPLLSEWCGVFDYEINEIGAVESVACDDYRYNIEQIGIDRWSISLTVRL